MKNNKLIFIFATTGLFALLGITGRSVKTVRAEEIPSDDETPRMQSMSFYGDTTSQMAFNWNTTNLNDSNLQVVKADDSNGFNSANVKKFVGTVEKSNVAGDKFIHRALATGLDAGTKYKFRFGDEELNTWCDEGSFVTSTNTNKDFRFVHLSDPQGKSEDDYDGYFATLKEVEKTNPSFIALTGDVVNNSWEGHTPILDQWEWALTKQWPILKNIPQMPVSGNHDGANNDFNSRFNLPHPENADTRTGTYYSFDFEGVHFICLNTNDSGHDVDDASALNQAQYTWLKNDLRENENARFKVVLMHKGMFDSGSHCSNQVSDSPDYDIELVREQITPLFTKYKVDLVLQGHDHLYSETYPTIAISDPNGSSYTQEDITTVKTSVDGEEIDTYNNPQGTIYLNTGSASGSKYYAITNYDDEIIHIRKTENTNKKMYTVLDVKGSLLVARTYALDEKDQSVPYASFAINRGENINPNENDGSKGCKSSLTSSSYTLAMALIASSAVFCLKKTNNKKEAK